MDRYFRVFKFMGEVMGMGSRNPRLFLPVALNIAIAVPLNIALCLVVYVTQQQAPMMAWVASAPLTRSSVNHSSRKSAADMVNSRTASATSRPVQPRSRAAVAAHFGRSPAARLGGTSMAPAMGSTNVPAVAVYPDSDKIGVFTQGRRDNVMVRRSSSVGYWDGEDLPGSANAFANQLAGIPGHQG